MNNKKIIKIKESPEFWRNAIIGLPKKVRSTVAKVVWWDHFAQRLVCERWAHLDEWLKEPSIDLSQAEWVKYLTKIGYTQNEAENRCTENRGKSRSRDLTADSGTGNRQLEGFSQSLGRKVSEDALDRETLLAAVRLPRY